MPRPKKEKTEEKKVPVPKGRKIADRTLAKLEQPPKPSSYNPPQQLEVRPEVMKKALRDTLKWWSLKPIETDEECAERLNMFFQMCAENGEYPTVEKMCLSLGYTVQNVRQWETGAQCSPTRTHMIRKAKLLLKSIDAELVNSSTIPVVSYIFRAKNFYGMADNVGGEYEDAKTERASIESLVAQAQSLPVKSRRQP